jgi:hypothetical protein
MRAMAPTTDPALSRLIRADLERARQRTGLGCWSVLLGIGTVVSLALGGYLVAEGLRYNHPHDVEQFGAIFGAATILLALATAATVWKTRQARSTLHDAVVTRRADVVWVYPKHTAVDLKAYYGGHHVGREQHLAMMIAFADATSAEVAMSSHEELSEATAVLARWLPHAQHGYSVELAQQYAAHPTSLRRA